MFGVERLDFDTVMDMAVYELNKNGYYHISIFAKKPMVGFDMATLVTFILWVNHEVIVEEFDNTYKVTLS